MVLSKIGGNIGGVTVSPNFPSNLALNARLRRELPLQKSVGDGIPLVGVGSPPIRLKVEPAEAKSSLIVNPGEDTLAGIAAILTGEAARLEINPIPVENRIE